MSSSQQPHHDLVNHRFEIALGDSTAKLDYSLQGKDMTITHTFVPGSMRGQGIAGQLAQAAFEFAAEKQLSVIPQCSYIPVYAARHPEAAALLKSQPNS